MKRSYEKPELTKVGTLTKLTQVTLKDLGTPNDGAFLRTTSNPLTNIS